MLLTILETKVLSFSDSFSGARKKESVKSKRDFITTRNAPSLSKSTEPANASCSR